MSWKAGALVALVIGMAAMTTSIRATEGNSGTVTYNKDVLPILQTPPPPPPNPPAFRLSRRTVRRAIVRAKSLRCRS